MAFQSLEPFIPAGPTNPTGGSGGEVFFKLKEHLKSVGWTVSYSGDANGAYGDHTDVITHGGYGNGGMRNYLAYVVLRNPDGREVLFQVFENNTFYQSTWRFTYSKGGLFTGGDTNTAPTASDEAVIRGENFTSVFNQEPWQATFFAVADSASPYGFGMVGYDADGTNASDGMFAVLFDPTIGDDSDDNVVLYMPLLQATLFPPFKASGDAQGAFNGFHDDGSPKAWFDVFRQCLAMSPSARDGGTTRDWQDNSLGTSKDGHVILMPLHYGRPNFQFVTPVQWKGLSTMLAWVSDAGDGVSAPLGAGDTLYTSSPASPNWIMVSEHIAMRWSGSAGAVNRSAKDITGTSSAPILPIAQSASKSQFSSSENLDISFNPFVSSSDGSYITEDVATLVIKKPDGTILDPEIVPTFDTDIGMWVATVPVGSFQQGEWLVYATSDRVGSLPQFATLWWGDYVDDILETRQAVLGKWRINGTTLELYEDDGVTLFATFSLKDENGDPTSTRIFERTPT